MSKKTAAVMEYTMTTHNRKIYDFYERTKLDFEETNLMFIDFIEKTRSVNSPNHIVEKINLLNQDINVNFNKFKDDVKLLLDEKKTAEMKELKDLISSLKTEIIETMDENNEAQQEYDAKQLEEIKTIINASFQEKFLSISNTLNENKNSYVNEIKTQIKQMSDISDKSIDDMYNQLKLFLYDFIPKSDQDIIEKIKNVLFQEFKEMDFNSVKSYCSSINAQLQNFFSSFDDNNNAILNKLEMFILQETQKINENIKDNKNVYEICKHLQTNIDKIVSENDKNSDFLKKIEDNKSSLIREIDNNISNMRNFFKEINEKTNEIFFEKIKNHLLETIPKNNDTLYDKFEKKISNELRSEIKHIIEGQNIDIQFKNIESKINEMAIKSQNTNNIEYVKEKINEILNTNSSFLTIVNDFNSKLKELSNADVSLNKSINEMAIKVNESSNEKNNLLVAINQSSVLIEKHLDNILLKTINTTNDNNKDLIANYKQQFATFMDTEMHKLSTYNVTKENLASFIDGIEKKLEMISSNIASMNKIQDNSSLKGQNSEKTLEDTLNKMYPTCNIKNNTNERHSGDFFVEFEDDTILIENKCYKNNVPTIEVQKFIADVERHNVSGILLSQESGVVLKKNFEIEITPNKNVVLYVHNCDYNKDIIRTSIDIVKYFRKSLNESTSSSDGTDEDEDKSVTIDEYEYAKLKKEYEQIVNKLNTNTVNLRNDLKGMKERIDNMHLSLRSLEEITVNELNIFFQVRGFSNVVSNSEKIVCEYCNKIFNSKQGFGKHTQSCMKKHKPQEGSVQI